MPYPVRVSSDLCSSGGSWSAFWWFLQTARRLPPNQSMTSLADAEIDDQVKAAKREWQETVTQAKEAGNDQTNLPPGVSRHDFTKWKEQQAVAARRRLAELEERLQRLQMLRSKLARMKANADETLQRSDVVLGSGHLPGQPQHKHNGTAKLGTMSATGNSQWTTLEDVGGYLDSSVRNGEDADDEVPLGAHARMPAYLPPHQGMAPPFTPGLSGMRKIIRDEMTQVVTQVLQDRLGKRYEKEEPGLQCLVLLPLHM